MYTIKEMAKKVGISEHTLRYYCKEGLFPFLTRDKNNVRRFTEEDTEGVRTVLCLRDSNMALQDIRTYMELCKLGKETLPERLEIIQKAKEETTRQLEEILAKQKHLQEKEDFYQHLIETGGDDLCNPLIYTETAL